MLLLRCLTDIFAHLCRIGMGRINHKIIALFHLLLHLCPIHPPCQNRCLRQILQQFLSIWSCYTDFKNDWKSQQALCQLSALRCSAKQQDSELFLSACPIDRHPLFIAALCYQQTVLEACPAAADKDRRKHIHLLFGKLLQRAGFLLFILSSDHPHPATGRIRCIILGYNPARPA